MNVSKILKIILTRMCVIFTCVISSMYALGYAVSDNKILFVPTPSMALLILLFSAVVGAASLVLGKDKTTLGKTALHFIICAAAYILVFVIGGGFSPIGGVGILAILLFIAVYAVSMIIRQLIIRKKSRANDGGPEDDVYTPLFK